jgi:hypothetical protein
MTKYLDIYELAELLGESPETIRRSLRRNPIKAFPKASSVSMLDDSSRSHAWATAFARAITSFGGRLANVSSVRAGACSVYRVNRFDSADLMSRIHEDA